MPLVLFSFLLVARIPLNSFICRPRLSTPQANVALPGAPVKNVTVNFQGASVIWLVPKQEGFRGFQTWPMTALGKAIFSKKDLDLFQSTYKETSLASGNHQWPNVNAMTRCPCCNTQQQTEKDYWMVCYYMIQMPPPDNNPQRSFLAARQMARLVCLGCMDRISQGCTITLNNETEPLSNYLQDYGTLCLVGQPDNNMYPRQPLDAWTLFTKWTDMGVWTALGRFTQNQMKLTMGSPTATANCQACRTQVTGDNIFYCGRCRKTIYCSRPCQVAHWKQHKHVCVPEAQSDGNK